jgi:hypothetical protein
MNANAVPHAHVKGRLRLVPVAVLLTAAAMLLGGMGADAIASPVGKDGKIHACYRVKGKPKGALRVVPNARKRCRRGERKVNWSIAGFSGQAGSTGQQGQAGDGAAGSNGASGSTNEALLASKIASLDLRMDSLEGVLGGVTNEELTGMVSTLDGVTKGELNGTIDTVKDLTNLELTEAVDSLPAIDAVCEQNKKLTEQVNLLQGVIGDLGLSPALEALGLLEIPTLPTELAPFACPTP